MGQLSGIFGMGTLSDAMNMSDMFVAPVVVEEIAPEEKRYSVRKKPSGQIPVTPRKPSPPRQPTITVRKNLRTRVTQPLFGLGLPDVVVPMTPEGFRNSVEREKNAPKTKKAARRTWSTISRGSISRESLGSTSSPPSRQLSRSPSFVAGAML